MEQVIIPFDNKKVILTYEAFDTDIDMDEITKIDYSNLFGEMVTVSNLMNKIGLLKADVEAVVKDHDMQLSILKAEKMEAYRKSLTREVPYVRGTGSKTVEAGSTEVENHVLMDKAYKIKWIENIKIHKNKEYIESLYWSIKSKDDKLNALMKGVTPVEFANGIIEGKVNTIMISNRKSVLPQMPKFK